MPARFLALLKTTIPLFTGLIYGNAGSRWVWQKIKNENFRYFDTNLGALKAQIIPHPLKTKLVILNA